MISNLHLGLRRVSNLILLSTLFVFPVRSQIAGGMNETTSSNWGGNNYIAGIVFWPDGSPVNTRISIKLQSMTKGEILASTDDSGKFVFSRLSSGLYTVVVDGGRELETVNQEIEIIQARNSGSQTYSVTIRLRYKAKSEAKPSVIKADQAAVPKKALEIYRQAVKLARSSDHRAAIEQLKLAIAEYPSYLDALNELGVQYMRLNELEKADEALQSALKIKPEAFEPLVNYGIVLFRLQRFDEAESILRAALEVKKNSSVVHYYLGRTLTELQRFDEAEKELKLALTDSDDQMTEVHRMLANLYIAKGENKQAVKVLETYLELVPTAPDAEKLRRVISELKKLPAKPVQAKPQR
jgi:Tfp pilus assembly protein PilF